MALAPSFRTHPTKDKTTHVVLIGATPEAASSGRKQVGDIVYHATHDYKCSDLLVLHTGDDSDLPAALATYLVERVVGTGPLESFPKPLGLSIDALRWPIRLGRHNLDAFASAVERARIERPAHCLVVITDRHGFELATGRYVDYLGRCDANVVNLGRSRPYASRLHSELIAKRR